MEDLSPLLLLDDNAISALPNEVCFLLSGQGSSIGCPMFVLFHIFVNKSSNGQHEEAMVHVRIFHDVFCLFSTLSVSLVWKTFSFSWCHVWPESLLDWERKCLISSPPPPQHLTMNVKREQVWKRNPWVLLIFKFWLVMLPNCTLPYFSISHLLSVSLPSLTANSGSSTLVPTVELIEELEMFNVQWTPDKLDTLSAETFRDTVETLGSVDNYSADQLAVLSDKAAKVEWRHWSWFCSLCERGRKMYNILKYDNILSSSFQQ